MQKKSLLFFLGVLATLGAAYNTVHWFDGLTQNRIGYVFFKIDKNGPAGFRWFQRSAEKGNPKGKLNLGHCYLCGHGTEKNYPKARFWLSRSTRPEARELLQKLDGISDESFAFTETIPAGTRSCPGGPETRVEVEIRNGTERFLDFRWIDFEGNLDLVRRETNWGHASIGPGGLWRQTTYVGHPFVIVDPLRGETLGSFVFRKPGTLALEIWESGKTKFLTELTRGNGAEARNPFGVKDVQEINQDKIRHFASQVALPGGWTDANAKAWGQSQPPEGAIVSIEGDWSSRWNRRSANTFWTQGTAQIKTKGDTVFILYKDQDRYLVEAKMEQGLLLGKYLNLANDRDTGTWIGKLVGNDRIDGQWESGRWDFRR